MDPISWPRTVLHHVAISCGSHKDLSTVWNSSGNCATAPWNPCWGMDCAIDLTSVEILAFNALLQSSSVGSLPATRAKIERTWGRVSNDAPRTSWLRFGFSSMPHNWFVTALLSSSSALNGSFAKKCYKEHQNKKRTRRRRRREGVKQVGWEGHTGEHRWAF